MSTNYSPGLEGIIAGETSISTVEGGLRYRGYPVAELAELCCFDEVAYLLLHGELPKTQELRDFQNRLQEARTLPPMLLNLLSQVPKNASPLDVLRTGISILSHFDPDTADNSPAASLRKSERLLAQIPLVIAADFRIRRGEQPVTVQPGLDTTRQFFHLLTGSVPIEASVRAFDVSLILYAEHEFNASTFTARTIVSTESDLHSAITGAIGALKGRLHGGANEKVMDILLAIGGPDQAENWTKQALARKERIMGFGHRVYKHGDVRAGILKTFAKDAAAQIGAEKWEETAEIVEQVMAREKNMYPNLDWPAGRLYHALGLEIPIYTPIFAMSRITGWCAHVMEQLANNRLIRPRSLYKGPEPRTVTKIADR